MTEIGKNVLENWTNKSFTSLLYNEVDKKFDGDDNALIMNLEKELMKQNLSVNLYKNMLKSGGNNTNPFQNIDKQNFYPQVYIPFYEELKQKGILGKKSPIMVPFVAGYDEDKTVFTGYVLNKDGEVEKYNKPVTEELAKSNEIWAISLNERVTKHDKKTHMDTR